MNSRVLYIVLGALFLLAVFSRIISPPPPPVARADWGYSKLVQHHEAGGYERKRREPRGDGVGRSVEPDGHRQ